MLPTTNLPQTNNAAAAIPAIVGFMIFSSTMLIINKAAILWFKLPTLLLWLQMLVSAVLVYGLGKVGYLKVDELEWGKVKAYSGVIVVFIANLYTNIKAMQYTNVETVIVFQTLTSLAIVYGDFKLLNQGMPSQRIIGSLVLMVIGGLLYVFVENDSSKEFQSEGVIWIGLYFIAKVVEMLYTKHILDTVPMSSWGRSYYNNFLSLLPVGIMVIGLNEQNTFMNYYTESYWEEPMTLFLVSLSCLMGLGMSITGLKCREIVSATSFSVIGNVNKVFTVFVNFFIWDKHASLLGCACLLLCLLGGFLYARFRQEEMDQRAALQRQQQSQSPPLK